MKVAVVGATGLVGRKMLQVLEERNFPVTELIPVASERSIGKEVFFKGKPYKVVGMEDAIRMRPQIAIFSAGGDTSLAWAPRFAEAGITVVDNSSAWRMDPSKKLAYRIKRVVVSTYQSVTGSGVKGIRQLEGERAGEQVTKAYAHEIDKNCLPHCDSFTENGYTKEEMKLINETCKIFDDPTIKVTATAVRVPVTGGHSESVNVELEKDFDLNEVRNLLSQAPGIVLQDDPANNLYPMAITAHEKDDVFVGRLRRDYSQPNTLNMWVVSDNLRKGAATNAIQIAEYLYKQGLITEN